MGAAGAPSLHAALCDPALYPHRPDRVDVLETHISTVYLAGELVLKVKKPLVLPFLDYGTPDLRRRMCEEELRLNRRLAPSLYLGLRALVPDRDGPLGWRLTDDARDPQAREYAVAMRRFDERHTLASLLDADCARREDLEALGRRLARFHLAASKPVDAAGWPSRLARAVEENFDTLETLPCPPIAGEQLAAGRRFSSAFLAGCDEALRARIGQGWIRDGHGDLRAEHVLTGGPEPEVFDCVEFDPRLREIDVAADLAFLVMDLVFSRREDLVDALLAGYREGGGDPGPDRLLAFFAAYRAWVRAKVHALRAAELEQEGRPHRGADEEAARLAGLARRLAWRARGPQLVVLAGPAASGKSFLAAHLAPRAGLAHVESDRVRKELVGLAPDSRAPSEAYAATQNERTYRALGRRAAGHLRSGQGVIVAATFRFRRDREAFFSALGAAGEEGRLVVECRAPVEVLLDRAERRESAPHRESDAGPAQASRQAAEFEAVDQLGPAGHLRLATDRPVADIADDVEAHLDARLRLGPRGEKPQPDRGLRPTPKQVGEARIEP